MVSPPVLGSFRGTLIIWNNQKLEVLDHELGAYFISICCKVLGDLREWVFSGVYEPNMGGEVDDFFG